MYLDLLRMSSLAEMRVQKWQNRRQTIVFIYLKTCHAYMSAMFTEDILHIKELYQIGIDDKYMVNFRG